MGFVRLESVVERSGSKGEGGGGAGKWSKNPATARSYYRAELYQGKFSGIFMGVVYDCGIFLTGVDY